MSTHAPYSLKSMGVIQIRVTSKVRWGVSKTWGNLLASVGLISLADA